MKQVTLSALKWGVIGGLAAIIVQTIFLLLGIGAKGGAVIYIIYLPLIFIMIYGAITIRKENGGSLPYGKAFLAIFIIAMLGSFMLNIYVYRIWAHYIDADLMNKIMKVTEDKMRDQAEKSGQSDETVDKQIAYVKSLPFELISYGSSVFCSLVLSLICAAFVSRPEDRPIKPAE
jgi:hypothetical protein